MALDVRGTPLPLYHRKAWARAVRHGGVDSSLVAVRSPSGQYRAAFAVETARSRALPGHRLLSASHVGVGSGGMDAETLGQAMEHLCSTMRSNWRALRLTVDVFAIDAEAKTVTEGTLRRLGFVASQSSRNYERTLILDLSSTEDQLFAALHKNARTRIRGFARQPVRIRNATIADVSRMQDLANETRARTTGEQKEIDWPAFVEMSDELPHLSRIVVLERTDVSGPDAVLAFAWGCMHGMIAEYSESASTRTQDMKLPTNYALLWDLVLWARRGGARLFDLGGVTAGSTDSADPLGGISDFKRRFSEHEVEVGRQWDYYPRPQRAAAARTVNRATALVRSGLRWFKSGRTR